jgi:hypothetical protein
MRRLLITLLLFSSLTFGAQQPDPKYPPCPAYPPAPASAGENASIAAQRAANPNCPETKAGKAAGNWLWRKRAKKACKKNHWTWVQGPNGEQVACADL